VLMKRFEDALRTVPGCEGVTLPYWDITDRPPAFMFAPPFATYTLPVNAHANYPAGYLTMRYNADQIMANVTAEDIPGIIDDALEQPIWKDFITFVGRGIEAAHDAGHPAIGVTMSVPDVAAFDPIFWFFHSNWDRLWWRWQQSVGATTLQTFTSTIVDSSPLFLSAPFNVLPPFSATADRTIDLTSMDISYAEPAAAQPHRAARRGRVGSLSAADGARVVDSPRASVRLKGIDRLAIPGSFRARLMADGQTVGTRTFFQSTEPVDCANCREHAKIDLDFLVDVDQLRGKVLTASIEPIIEHPDLPRSMPLASCGSPTLNVRLLVERA
jgi:tyrosinase